MQVPHARGPLSAWVRDVLVGVDPGHAPDVPEDALTGNEDAQLALWMTYELHYRGFDDVSPDAEWDLGILALRRQLERRFEEQLRAVTASAEVPLDTDVGEVLLDLAQSADGPSIALRLQRDATVDQMRDYLSQRSIVQLKESDPHSFVLGRLDGAAKVALAELQYDEYGGGRPGRLHAALYAQALRAAGLDPQYGAYIEQASAVTLASVNVMSMFAFNRRLRGASMGHLAIFEATSSLPVSYTHLDVYKRQHQRHGPGLLLRNQETVVVPAALPEPVAGSRDRERRQQHHVDCRQLDAGGVAGRVPGHTPGVPRARVGSIHPLEVSAGNRYRQEHRVTARQHRLDDLGGGWFPGPVDVAAHGGTVGNVRQNALDEVRARRVTLRAPRADLRAQLGLAHGRNASPPAV